MDELLKDYPVVVDLRVAWGEMDAYGHVNNTVYFRYLESGRIAYFERLDLFDYLQEHGIGPILASVQCRFRIPLTYPDMVSVGTRVTAIEGKRFTVESLILSHRHQKVAAQGEGVVVAYNYREERSALLPDALCRRIEALEGKKLTQEAVA